LCAEADITNVNFEQRLRLLKLQTLSLGWSVKLFEDLPGHCLIHLTGLVVVRCKISRWREPGPGMDAFSLGAHAAYFRALLDRPLPSQLQGMDSNRLTLTYFAAAGVDLLGEVGAEGGGLSEEDKERITVWVLSLQVAPTVRGDPGGFRGAPFFVGSAAGSSGGGQAAAVDGGAEDGGPGGAGGCEVIMSGSAAGWDLGEHAIPASIGKNRLNKHPPQSRSHSAATPLTSRGRRPCRAPCDDVLSAGAALHLRSRIGGCGRRRCQGTRSRHAGWNPSPALTMTFGGIRLSQRPCII